MLKRAHIAAPQRQVERQITGGRLEGGAPDAWPLVVEQGFAVLEHIAAQGHNGREELPERCGNVGQCFSHGHQIPLTALRRIHDTTDEIATLSETLSISEVRCRFYSARCWIAQQTDQAEHQTQQVGDDAQYQPGHQPSRCGRR